MPTAHRVAVADGESVAAVHHAAPTDRWLVFCHGFRSDKSGSYERRCERAVTEGYNAVRFDFRGCGESDGAFVEGTLSAKLADLRAVVDHFAPDRYALFGSSFGGKVAFHHAVDATRVTAVAARCPVTYNRAFDAYRERVAAEGEVALDADHRIDGRFFDDFGTYDFEDVTDALDVPVAIFHGRADDSVPVDDSVDAAAALGTDTLLQTFADEGHLFSEAAESRMRDLLFAWLATTR